MRVHDFRTDEGLLRALLVAVLLQVGDVLANLVRRDARLRDARLPIRAHGVDGSAQVVESKIDEFLRHFLRQKRRIRRDLHLVTDIGFLDLLHHTADALVKKRLACRVKLDEFDLLALMAAEALHILQELVKKLVCHIAERTAVLRVFLCALPAHQALEVADVRRLDAHAQRYRERHDLAQCQAILLIRLGKRHNFIFHDDSSNIAADTQAPAGFLLPQHRDRH